MADPNASMSHVDTLVTPALFYIEALVKALNKKNSKAVTQEISAICAHLGPTASRHLLKLLFGLLDFSLDPLVIVKNKDFHQAAPIQFLQEKLTGLLTTDLPLLRTLLNFCLENATPVQRDQILGNPQLIPLLGRILRFNREQENRLCILLLKSNIPQIRQQAGLLIQQKLPDILKHFCDADERLLHDIDKTVFHEICQLLEPGQREEFASRVTPEQEEEFRLTLRRLYPHSRQIPLQLKPLLLNQLAPDLDSVEILRRLEMSRNPHRVNLDSDHDLLARLLIEFGFKALDSIEAARSCLNAIPVDHITPESVARCIGILASTVPVEDLSKEEVEAVEMDQNVRNTGYYIMWSRGEIRTSRTTAKDRDRHRMQCFVSAVCEKCPGLSWREVVYEMDHEGFLIHDRAGLQLVRLGLEIGLRDTQFPIELLYRHWTNADAQLSWFTYALKNPDVFCFSDYPSDRADIHMLKVIPDEYRHKDIQVWQCFDLVETLFSLADSGFSLEVMNLLETPLLRCPDVLLVTTLQLSPSSVIVNSRSRQTLVRMCVQKLLVTHPNSQSALSWSWNSYPNNKLWAQHLIIEAMAEWYITSRYDQARLYRIIDVAQELKSLADLLQCDILPFAIDLACLAARRGYLNLDKWMGDKMTEHGMKFVTACLKFLERRCPTLVSGDPEKDEQMLPRNAQLPADMITTFLHHLQYYLPQISNNNYDVAAAIMKLIQNGPAVAKRPHPPPNELRRMSPTDAPVHAPVIPPVEEPVRPAFSPAFVKPNPMLPAFRPIGASPNPLQLSEPDSRFTRLQKPPTPPVIPPQENADPYGYLDLPEVKRSYPAETENEIYAHFKALFNEPNYMARFLNILRSWKQSTNEADQMKIDCTIKTVLDEHQWLEQYPDKEFELTARFFGALIGNGYLSFMGLGLALRQLLDFLKHDPTTHNRRFKFAGLAMDMFKERLNEYAQYCNHVMQTPNFNKLPQMLQNCIISAARGEDKIGVSPLPQKILSPGLQPVQNEAESDESDSESTPMVVPPETFRDEVAFLFNNLSMANVREKVGEFKKLLADEQAERYVKWVADYVVRKRAALESNFHPLYHNFVEKTDVSDLHRFIVKDTVTYIRTILQRITVTDSTTERSTLKNLGSWLGYMTLAMNKPVRARDLDMKALIVEAFHKGQKEIYLNYAIPLVTRIIALSAKSKLFGKTNPWIKTILQLLGSIHAEQDTKLNIKFEIEVLAKALELSVADLGESPFLKNSEYVRWVLENCQQLNADAKRKPQNIPAEPGVGMDAAANQSNPALMMMGMRAVPSALDASRALSPAEKPMRFSYKDQVLNPADPRSVVPRMHFNAHIGLFQGDAVRMMLGRALVKTLEESMMTCMDLCLRVAVPATQVIVKKDFSLDPDPERIRTAARVMVRHLAAGIALSTRRDHIMSQLTAHAKDFLTTHFRMGADHTPSNLTKACDIFARDNIELCVAWLRKASAERCMMEIDKHIQEEVKVRVEAKNLGGKMAIDEKEAAFHRDRMPPALRLTPGGQVPPAQVTIYEHFFQNIPGFVSEVEAAAVQAAREQYEAQQMLQRPQIGARVPQPMGIARPGVPDIREDDFGTYCDAILQKLAGQINVMSSLVDVKNIHLQLALRLKTRIQDARLNVGSRGIQPAAGDIATGAVELMLEGLSSDIVQSIVSRQLTEPHSQNPAHDAAIRFKDSCLGVIAAVGDPKMLGPQSVTRIVTQTLARIFTEAPQQQPVVVYFKPQYFETFYLLIRSRYVVLTMLDICLSRVIDMPAGAGENALKLAQNLVRAFCVEEKLANICGESDLHQTIEAIFRYCSRHNDVPFTTHYLMEEVKVDLAASRRFDHRLDAALETSPYAAGMHQMISGLRDYNEAFPISVREKAEGVLREWITMSQGPHFGPAMHAIEKSCDPIPQAMELIRTAFLRVFNELRELLQNESLAVRFFKFCIDVAARDCYRMVSDHFGTNPSFAQDQMRAKMASTLDSIARLFVLIIRFSVDGQPMKTNVPWLRDPALAISKLLGIVAAIMFSHQELYDQRFLAYPFHRIVYSLYMDLFIPEFKFNQFQEQILLSFCNFFHVVRPQRIPGFTASWLELVYHRDVIRRVNEIPEKRGWEVFIHLIVDNIKFVAPFVRSLNPSRAISAVFRAALRFLYTLYHDHPEVLAEYYCILVDIIPTNCLNMRNVVLSAAPLAIGTDDPYKASCKIEEQKGINFMPPRIVTRYHTFLQPVSFRNDLDSYLNSRAPVTFLSDLTTRLEQSRVAGHKYHVQMLNALVLYLGQQAVQALTNKGLPVNSTTVAHSSNMDIIQSLAINFDNEGRYLLINALVNHLRYANSHTHYYYCVILHLFREMSDHPHFQELIVRVLMERITTHPPHPWGLIITCAQLIRSPECGFFEKDFVNFNDDLLKLPMFSLIDGLPKHVVARIMNGDQAAGDGVGAVGNGDGILDRDALE